MKILITGCGGMLGTDLARALSPLHEVLGVGRRDAAHLEVPYQKLDLADLNELRALFAAGTPDVVFHTAAMTEVDRCEEYRDEAFRDNVTITENIIQACNETGSLLIQISTDYVFDGKKDGEYCENDTTGPLNVYGRTKWQAEEAVRQKARRYLIFRMSWLYGLYGPSFPRTILKKAAETDHLKIVCDQVGRPTSTADSAGVFAALLSTGTGVLEKNAGETFHIGNAGSGSWADLAEVLITEAGCPEVRIERVGTEHFPRPAARPRNSVLSLKKAKERLGIEMRPWQQAAREFVTQLKREKA